MELEDKENFKGEIVVARDVTERKRAEEKLKRSRKRFKNLADLLPQPVWETDLKGNLTYANRTGYEKLGYEPKDPEEKGIPMTELLASEERERVTENFKKTLSGKNFDDHQYTCLKKNGETFPCLIYSALIIKDG